MKCFHLMIIGDVVGVGFRGWMMREADKLNLVGWVKNREDRAVEAVIQGEEEQVKKIIELCKKGPDVAWVEKVTITEQPVDKNFFTFEMVY
ncbi:acylphosphatase [Patescibacteria group bacterium]|nr:acylphosphatase [Patescibacteria group bacterium]